MTDLLHSLDALNSYVRSDACRNQWDSWNLRKAVYTYKNEFLRVYVPKLLPKCEVVRCGVECRDCGGTGRYVDSNGYELDHCYACNSSGNATLSFVETAWPDGPVWHTPVGKWPSITGHSTYYDMPYRVPWLCKYEPNQSGKPLSLNEAVDAIIRVETWYWESGETRPVSNDWCASGSSWDYSSYPNRGFLQYKLNVGERDVCPLCRVNRGKHRCHNHKNDLFFWVEPVCESCNEKHGSGIWDSIPSDPPWENLNDAALRWSAHHASILQKHGPRPREKVTG